MLARLGAQVTTIERHADLAEAAREQLGDRRQGATSRLAHASPCSAGGALRIAVAAHSAEPLQRLRTAAIAPIGLDPIVLTELVRSQTDPDRVHVATITQLDAAIGALLLSHRNAQLLAPLPRIGEINLAQIIAEIGPLLDRCDNADQAAAGCGVAPITRQSGKSRNVQFRFSGNARARVALTCFADNSRHSSPWARHLYTTARQRGIRHPHAIRVVARAWLRVIWACWHTNTIYDPDTPHRRSPPRRLT